MKIICYGVSGNAFINYFQMAETATRRCASLLSKGLVQCCTRADIYLRRPSKANVRNIVALHQQVHKIPRMLYLLDVTKIH
jgi:hypothetical protein